MSDREEALLERAFVLHHRAFRNTSLLLDCMTENHGRISLIGQGARRVRGGQRALLQPFTALKISWIRRGEIGRLTHVEAEPHIPPLTGDGLLAGFYLNELLIRLVARGDANPALFGHYRASLEALMAGGRIARTVRLFELGLLDTLGYRVELERDCKSGHEIVPDEHYVFELEAGFTLAQPDQRNFGFPGAHLISLREGRLEDGPSLHSARRLLGAILDAYVGGRPLRSRDVMHELVGRRRRTAAESIG